MSEIARRREVELLLDLCLTPISADRKRHALSLASHELDWDWFFSRAESWQVEPVVTMNLLSAAAELLPPEKRIEAGARRLDARARALSAVTRVNQLVAKFGHSGIPVIVIKGPATGVTAYDDVSLRIFGDADLLVKTEDVSRAAELVQTLGFAPLFAPSETEALIRAGHALEFKSETFKVELHTELLSKYLRVPFDNDEIWATARSVRCGDHSINVLAPDVEFLFLSAHGAKHEWVRFRWICDVAQLIPRLAADDVDRVVILARALNAGKLLSLALQLVKDTFGLALPKPFEKARTAYDTAGMSAIVLRNVGVNPPDHACTPGWISRAPRAMQPLAFWIATRERLRDRILSVADLALKRYR